MKNKILIASSLVIVFVLFSNVYAMGQNNSGADIQTQQQTQTSNQGENTQIQTQNTIQTQTQTGTQTQQQSPVGTSSQAQNQNQTQNQEETNQIQNNGQEGTKSQNQYNAAVAEQRKSQVANAVQEMLQVAEKNTGIGQQVKIIAQTQTQNQEKLETSLKKVQIRSAFTRFFIGADYGEINNAKKLLEQNREQIMQLNQVKTQLANQAEQQTLALQVQALEQTNLQIENSLNSSQKGFSLFGWLFRWLAK